MTCALQSASVYLIFVTSVRQKSVKLTLTFLAFPELNFFENWLNSSHIQYRLNVS